MNNVVFLDYDGVVNTPRWFITENEDGEKEFRIKYNWPRDGRVNDEDAVQWVSEFCERNDYKIVVTSTWRSEEDYASYLRNAGLRDEVEVIGKTQNFGEKRAAEIREYLSNNAVDLYLIFDDDVWFFSEDEELMKHLILCDASHGFKETEFERAMELHYDLKWDRSSQNDIGTNQNKE